MFRAAINPDNDDVDVVAPEKIVEEKRETLSSSIAQVENLRQLRRVVLARRRQAVTEQEDEERNRQDKSFLALALVPCVLAYVSWEQLSLGLANFVNMYGTVPGSGIEQEFENNLLRPTITGIVVPVTSIAFATLLSTTVSVLREKQVDLRILLNKEACDLRLLRRTIFGMFGTRQHAGRRAKALTLLTAYVDQLDRECHLGGVKNLEELELSAGIATNELDQVTAMLHGVDGAAACRQETISAADDIIARLNGYRSERVALLLTDFPDLHWVVLISLSVSLCVTFLLESNQFLDEFLSSIQLRVLFALLVGVFSATAELCLDLADPFTGSFSLVSASTQIGDLGLCLREDAREANSEASEISSATRHFLWSRLGGGPVEVVDTSNNYNVSKQFSSGVDDGIKERDSTRRSPSRYGVLSTIYFHLLTGPLGSNVRALGDVAAWAATMVTRRTKALLAWRRWPWRWKNRKGGTKE